MHTLTSFSALSSAKGKDISKKGNEILEKYLLETKKLSLFFFRNPHLVTGGVDNTIHVWPCR
jgi:hypothetical protein